MTAEQVIVVAAGALAGGFVSGLMGFGTAITSIGPWLYVLPPTVTSSLVVVCSVVAQLQTLPRIWRFIEARRVMPFILAGIAGVPCGTVLLAHLDPRVLKIAIGALLLAFSAYMLLPKPHARVAWGGRAADAAVGFGGGVLGAVAGLSGPLPTVWVTLRGWSKTESRGVFQAYNLTILSVALVTHALSGLLTWQVGIAVAIALPGTIGGAWLGARAYGRLDDRRFRNLVLVLLCASGLSLIWTNR
ncbi:MAG TPA: sulfite exporter TauE/SafE family protein [Acidisphaera sp.]|nr:sulfite exporter TauE/SafE family protein [Acidisphaera sp.]